VAAAVGVLNEAPVAFEAVDDVPCGGVMCALPALMMLGLLRHTRSMFSLPPGFYPIEAIFMVVAFLALARVRSLEQMRYEAPGEWGKLLGLDRIPEVKTLRRKLDHLTDDQKNVFKWSQTVAKEWLEADAQSVGGLYVDGHVRVYHGKLTKLPRRYVSRERLCLRGTTDYWVNAMDGQPFFVVTQAVDPGLLQVLEEQIVPRLKTDVAGQPSTEALQADPRLHRFMLIFDREGYSPAFFSKMWEERIAVLTYHKFPAADWAEEEFSSRKVKLVSGEEVTMKLAERGVRLSNGFWVREIRYLDDRGHQTSVLSTNFKSDLGEIAAAMFARWCQENFFKYMQEHYSLDGLVQYATEALPETTRIVNPKWRELDGQVRRQQGLLTREQAQFGALSLPAEFTAEEAQEYEKSKGLLLQSIQNRQQEITELKAKRKEAGKHIALKDLPEADRFSQLATAKKHFVDTIKLMAYRAETLLVSILREKMSRSDDGRALIRQIFESSVDLRPDLSANTLTVRLHRLTNRAHDAALEHLCAEVTATETVFPGTELRLVFELIGAPPGVIPIPGGQEF
jgi:hypothetical protein